MPNVTGRRTYQLGNLMTMLKLRTVDFDKRGRTTKKDFRSSFDKSRLPGSRRPKEEQICYRPSWPTHPSQDRLIDVDKLGNSLILPNDLAAQPFFKFPNLRASSFGFEYHLFS